ncbi:MAG: hypothetical protein QNJ34_17165 [Xenococcaceae cyanobacterium MO_188.B29]|nr:hypothetical protein [Xenococcaceae cyanobacterium MO_188.B29]
MLTSHSQNNQSFDPIAFELERERIFNRTEKAYVEQDYEVDSNRDWCGSIYRVWKGRFLLGTFHQKSKKWEADPFYANGKYLELADSRKKTFNSNEQAIRHIISCYEGS